MRPAEVIDLYVEKQQEEAILAEAAICREYKASPAAELLDRIMQALVDDALEKLKACKTSDRDEIFALTLRWQERQAFMAAVHEQISLNIEEAVMLAQNRGIDLETWKARNDIER